MDPMNMATSSANETTEAPSEPAEEESITTEINVASEDHAEIMASTESVTDSTEGIEILRSQNEAEFSTGRKNERHLQIASYFRDLEERVSYLEHKLRTKAGSDRSRDEGSSVEGLRKSITMAPAVKRCDMATFENESIVQSHAIDVLYLEAGEPPEAVRINSPLVMKALDDIAHSYFTSSRPVIFVRPFKVLVSNIKKMRGYLEVMEKREAAEPTLESISAQTKNPETAERTAVVTDQSADSTPSAEPAKNLTPEEKEIHDMSEPRELLAHLRCLIKCIDYELGDRLDISQLTKVGKSTEVAFKDLWQLFKVGDVISCSRDAFRVFGTVGGYVPEFGTVGGSVPIFKSGGPGSDVATHHFLYHSVTSFKIYAFNYEFDGVRFSPCRQIFEITPYQGSRPLSSLPVEPMHLEEIYLRVRRGNKFARSTEVTRAFHSGVTLDGRDAVELHEEVVADMKMAYQLFPDASPHLDRDLSMHTSLHDWDGIHPGHKSPCNICGHVDDGSIYDRQVTADYFKAGLVPQGRSIDLDGITEDVSVLLPHKVHAFALQSRKWHCLDIDNIEKTKGGRLSFDDIVFPVGHKTMIQALVKTKANPKNPQWEDKQEDRGTDLIKGREKGLIVLLHGAPGNGKSSTVECVANYIDRPLMQINCGDLGVRAHEVEGSMDRIFALAQRWGCILELAEADVFLAPRNQVDMERNALVSVFVRLLQVFSGILFMTTNRVGLFDDALMSVIHVSLHYPPLDKLAIRKIWRLNIARTRATLPNCSIKERAIIGFAKEISSNRNIVWNGRQIRNAFQTALAFAQHEAQESKSPLRLTEEHFEIVANASSQFNTYLSAIHGVSIQGERNSALSAGTRRDTFRQEEVTSKPNKSKSKSFRISDSESEDSEEVTKRPKKSVSMSKRAVYFESEDSLLDSDSPTTSPSPSPPSRYVNKKSRGSKAMSYAPTSSGSDPRSKRLMDFSTASISAGPTLVPKEGSEDGQRVSVQSQEELLEGMYAQMQVYMAKMLEGQQSLKKDQREPLLQTAGESENVYRIDMGPSAQRSEDATRREEKVRREITSKQQPITVDSEE